METADGHPLSIGLRDLRDRQLRGLPDHQRPADPHRPRSEQVQRHLSGDPRRSGGRGTERRSPSEALRTRRRGDEAGNGRVPGSGSGTTGGRSQRGRAGSTESCFSRLPLPPAAGHDHDGRHRASLCTRARPSSPTGSSADLVLSGGPGNPGLRPAPAATPGAKIALPERPVVALVGDGGIALHHSGARHPRSRRRWRSRSSSGTTTAWR